MMILRFADSETSSAFAPRSVVGVPKVGHWRDRHMNHGLVGLSDGT
jgi:hypothetical protein